MCAGFPRHQTGARYTVAGYTGPPFGVSEPYTHRSGPNVETSAELPTDGAWIGDKPGLETCVVSQVVVDSLARLPLEGGRHTRRVHAGKRRESV